MQQGVPEFAYSEDALRLRQWLYERWCADGRGPNLREVHEGLGLPREAIIAAYKQLQVGNMVVLDPTSQNFNVWKMLPFSSFPSQVRVHLDGRFHSYAGCAMESVAISRMPPFQGKDVTLESYCSCCLEPVTVAMRGADVVGRKPGSVLIHVSMNPYEWGIPTLMAMCDSMNYVIDADHAEAYERMIGRRGVLFTLEQARSLVSGVADKRMWDYRWPNHPLTPDTRVASIRSLGVDVSNWEVSSAQPGRRG